MKLGQLSREQLSELTVEQITKIVYGNWKDDGSSAQVALLLGGKPFVCQERAEAAASLWRAGRVEYIMPTGGVPWDTPFGKLTEAELLRRYLIDMGVPDEIILMEAQATTTIENMIFATLQMERKFRIYNVSHVLVVTSSMHLNRATRVARNYLPASVKVSGYCIPREESDAWHWHLSPVQIERAEKEVRLLWRLITSGQTPDIEF